MAFSDYNFTINKKQIDKIFTQLKNKKFLVIGDYCLDLYCDVDSSLSETSIETLLDTVAVSGMKLSAAGAGNVVSNIASLGAKDITAIGVLGDDFYADAYIKLLSKDKVNTKYIVKQKQNFITSVYTKLYDGDDELPRIDYGNANVVSKESADTMIDNINSVISKMDIIIINQQLVNGLHTEYFQKKLQAVINANKNKIFILDGRDVADKYSGVILKCNDIEAAKLLKQNIEKIDYNSNKVIEKNIKSLYALRKKQLFITRGDRGIVAFDGKTLATVNATHITSKIDTVGAGDSATAAIAAALACEIDIQSAIVFANACSSVTIQKIREAGVATEKEVRHFISDMDFVYNQEIAQSIRKCPYVSRSEIEIISDRKKGKIEYAVFDHDGTISTLRKGWESIMAPLMVKAILGSYYNRASEKVLRKISEEAQVFIDKTTGIQTIRQMEGLVKLVRDYGYVKENEILDAKGYKKVYLDELNILIEKRIAKLHTGERDISDYTLKGSVDMLRKLRERGITLFLASGTDEYYVRKEAYDLGYGDLFNGGIYGAGDNVDIEPKKIVLDMIIKKIGEDKVANIVTFGDGPVEIRETIKRGSLAVGLASNEDERFGLNETKRKRLLLAGAHLIIPDFSQHDKLLNYIL